MGKQAQDPSERCGQDNLVVVQDRLSEGRYFMCACALLGANEAFASEQ